MAAEARVHRIVRFGILGSLQVVAGGREVPFGSGKQRTLLAVLIAQAGAVVSADRLAEVLWGREQPRDPGQAVHTHVSRLRSVLEQAGGKQARDALATRPPGYVLDVDTDQVDAARFERLVGEAKTAEDPAKVVRLADEALALWRGEPLAEFEAEFARLEAVRLQELRLGAIKERLEAMLALGRDAEAISELEALTRRHPLREELHGLLMLGLYRCRRQAEALAVYRALRDRLADELGLEPSPALRRLERDILQQSDTLAPSAAPPTGTLSVASATAVQEGRTEPSEGSDVPVGVVSAEATSFVGREQEVEELTAVLQRARLVTLTGPGGVGKTRLALRVVREVSASFPDGVTVCDLSRIDDPGTVHPVVATVLGVQPQQAGSVEDALIAFLRSKRLLLVVDNCEHVLDGVCAPVERIVRDCPQVCVLATSRQPLAVAGEHIWPVSPLELTAEGDGGAPASVRLFCDRAVAADPGFELTADTHPSVAEVCRRLDGLPLAIELAAARVRAMTPEDIAGRLDRRFELLTAGRRTAAARHRTLEAVVDWSYELLNERERQLFERLSVFAGGFGLEAAERVCAGEGVADKQVAELIADLVDHSLVAADRSGRHTRYRLLETLRAYGEARLQERAEVATWRRRHVEYFVALAEKGEVGLQGEEEGRWVAEFDRELDNLRAAHRWAVTFGAVDLALRLSAALTYYAYFRLRDEIFRWAEEARELPGAAEHSLYPAVCGAVGYGCANRGELDRAASYARLGLKAAGGETDPASLRPLVVLSDVALYEGRLHERMRLGELLTELARAAGHSFEESLSHLHQGLALAYTGRTDEALACVEQGRDLAAAAGNPTLLAWFLYLEGEVLLDAAPDRAAELLKQAIETARSVDNRFALGVAHVSAASLQARHGEPRRALAAFRDAVDHWHQSGDWTHQWTTLRNLVVLLARLHAVEAAAVLHGATATADTGAPAYGADAERLAATARALASCLGPDGFHEANARGRDMDDEEVVVYALAEVDRLLAGSLAQTS